MGWYFRRQGAALLSVGILLIYSPLIKYGTYGTTWLVAGYIKKATSQFSVPIGCTFGHWFFTGGTCKTYCNYEVPLTDTNLNTVRLLLHSIRFFPLKLAHLFALFIWYYIKQGGTIPTNYWKVRVTPGGQSARESTPRRYRGDFLGYIWCWWFAVRESYHDRVPSSIPPCSFVVFFW